MPVYSAAISSQRGKCGAWKLSHISGGTQRAYTPETEYQFEKEEENGEEEGCPERGRIMWDLIWIMPLVVTVIVEIRSCGSTIVTCREGRFTCTHHFCGAQKIYKETETTWWLWADELGGGNRMIIGHDCRIANNE